MHPSRRSLPFPLNCQLVRVGTADYGGAADQVSRPAESYLTLLGVCFGNEVRPTMLVTYLRSLKCVVPPSPITLNP